MQTTHFLLQTLSKFPSDSSEEIKHQQQKPIPRLNNDRTSHR